jgi:[acyl-carrier-protein] S-malonyltransferase
MMRAFVFPGQGSQAVGMGRALYDAIPAARLVFEEVDHALGMPLSRLIFDGSEETLRLTENAQPALMATSLAALRALEVRSGQGLAELGRVVAGHSLGEYSALAAAGSLALGDAARVLRVRGRAMQEAVPVGAGAMAAILGLELDAVEEVARQASEVGVCDLANDNAPGQAVVSGERAAVQRAVDLAKQQGARRSVLLPVSAPFHCRLLAPAAEAVAAALAEVAIRAPAVPVISNVAAEPESAPETLRARLVEQVTARVRWRESLLAMAELGVNATVELGAGRVLSGLSKRTLPGVGTYALGAPADIDGFIGELAA